MGKAAEEWWGMRRNLKEARQKAGMTQKQVAEYLGITLTAYQNIEYGTMLGKIKLRQEDKRYMQGFCRKAVWKELHIAFLFA